MDFWNKRFNVYIKIFLPDNLVISQMETLPDFHRLKEFTCLLVKNVSSNLKQLALIAFLLLIAFLYIYIF